MEELKYNKRAGHRTGVIRQVVSSRGHVFYLKKVDGIILVKYPSYFLETDYTRVTSISYTALRAWLLSKAK